MDVRLHRHLLIYPSTTDFHRFLTNDRRGKTSPLPVLEVFKQFRVSGVLVEAVDLLTSCSLSRRGLSTKIGSSGDTGF